MKLKATFGGGWFWNTEAKFAQLHGVVDTTVGYMGGNTENPTYEEVCSNTTGHIEVVQVTYDDEVICYNELLKRFFGIHDPTSWDSQNSDEGEQYRSVIFCHNVEQQNLAKEYINQLSTGKKYTKPIVTVIKQATTFYKAEEYHQQYYEKH